MRRKSRKVEFRDFKVNVCTGFNTLHPFQSAPLHEPFSCRHRGLFAASAEVGWRRSPALTNHRVHRGPGSCNDLAWQTARRHLFCEHSLDISLIRTRAGRFCAPLRRSVTCPILAAPTGTSFSSFLFRAINFFC